MESDDDLSSAKLLDEVITNYPSAKIEFTQYHEASPPRSPHYTVASPKRSQRSPLSQKPNTPNSNLVCGVAAIIGFVYIIYCFAILSSLIYPYSNTSFGGTLYICIFHICFCLLILSFFQTVKTDPGSIPPNWGFYLGDEFKRHRYCKVCNVWKPDRAHHCSVCKRCVLNMDHHCPWVNNCIGFMNRKFFIQLLFYATLCLLLILLHSFGFIITQGYDIFPSTRHNISTWRRAMSFLLLFAFAIMLLITSSLAITLVPFTRFHIIMILKNSTTIENIDSSMHYCQKYNIGTFHNVQQVMGGNILLWWLPSHTYTSKPVGNGVQWNELYPGSIYDNQI